MMTSEIKERKKPNPENVNINLLHIGEKNKTPFHDRISPDQKIRQNCGSKTVIPTGWQSRLWGDLCNGLTTMEINVLIKTHSKINYSWPVSEGPLFIQCFFKRLSGLSWGGHRGIPAYDWVDLTMKCTAWFPTHIFYMGRWCIPLAL